jgi:cation diffusion facilitator CzcD-associated flavoprotein CzcO
MATGSSPLPVVIVGAGISGLLLAQSLRRHGVPVRVFERDDDFTSRGVGWGLTLHWSLPALRALLPEDLVQRLPGAYVDQDAVAAGLCSRFPFYDLSTGQLRAETPRAPESHRIRVTREKLRRLLATGIQVEVRCSPPVCTGVAGSYRHRGTVPIYLVERLADTLPVGQGIPELPLRERRLSDRPV